jgi:hypothetical protein
MHGRKWDSETVDECGAKDIMFTDDQKHHIKNIDKTNLSIDMDCCTTISGPFAHDEDTTFVASVTTNKKGGTDDLIF